MQYIDKFFYFKIITFGDLSSAIVILRLLVRAKLGTLCATRQLHALKRQREFDKEWDLNHIYLM